LRRLFAVCVGEHVASHLYKNNCNLFAGTIKSATLEYRMSAGVPLIPKFATEGAAR
jgi:hypothetical protein